MMKINPRNVKSTSDVKPLGWADHAFIAETQNLAPRQAIYPACLGTTELRIGLPKCPLILIWIHIADMMVEEDTRILHFAKEQQPVLGLNAYIHPQAVQVIEILLFGEADSYLTLGTPAKFPTNAEPTRQS